MLEFLYFLFLSFLFLPSIQYALIAWAFCQAAAINSTVSLFSKFSVSIFLACLLARFLPRWADNKRFTKIEWHPLPVLSRQTVKEILMHNSSSIRFEMDTVQRFIPVVSWKYLLILIGADAPFGVEQILNTLSFMSSEKSLMKQYRKRLTLSRHCCQENRRR